MTSAKYSMSRKIHTQLQYEFKILTLFLFLEVRQNELHRYGCWRRGLGSSNGCSEWKVCNDELNLMGQFSLCNHTIKAKYWNAHFLLGIIVHFVSSWLLLQLSKDFFFFSKGWNCSSLTNCNKAKRIVLPKKEKWLNSRDINFWVLNYFYIYLNDTFGSQEFSILHSTQNLMKAWIWEVKKWSFFLSLQSIWQE